MQEDHQPDQRQGEQVLLLQQQLQLFEPEPWEEIRPEVVMLQQPAKTNDPYPDDNDLGDGFDCCR